MITTQKNRRLAVLCVIFALVFAAFMGITSGSVTADGIARSLTNVFTGTSTTPYTPYQSHGQSVALIPHQVHPLHSGRSWPIAQVGTIFTGVEMTQSTAHSPVSHSVSQYSGIPAETQYVGQGVALIPDYTLPQHSDRDWKISHL